MSHDSSLQPVLQAVEPAARLVHERHLRQVVNYLIDWGHALPTNTSLPLWVTREDLLAADVLPNSVLSGTEPRLLLVTDPNDRMIDRTPREHQLRVYWQVLFEAAILAEIDRKLAAGTLTPATCAERLRQFGPAAARETRYVLESEHFLDASADETGCYRAFVAVYLGTAAFERSRAEEMFPSLPPVGAVERALAAEIDHTALLAKCRPAGAAEPVRDPAPDERWVTPDTGTRAPLPRPGEPAGLLAHAMEAERNGNNVRAAILRTQVAAADSEDRDLAVTGALTAIGKLVDSLGDLFAWDHHTRQEWRQALAPLLEPAAFGRWPRAARCLYELQTLATDGAQPVFAVDLPEAIRTFGRRPVKRPLPQAKPVVILMKLKKAHAQFLRVELGHAAALRLDRLFHDQIHRTEHAIRHDFTPIIVDCLTRAGLVPTNPVEEVAREKLVAELLDRVCDRGYLRIGNLRDAIARNRLKMRDLANPVEFLKGDALLRADTYLAEALDGVHRRGEFYLRWIQRFSSVFFGTQVGRLLTLFVLLPFGGAFLTLMTVKEMEHLGAKVASFFTKPPAKVAPPAPTPPKANPDVIEADEVDVNADGEVVISEVKRGTVTSEDVEVDDEGEPIWADPEAKGNVLQEVFNAVVPTPPKPEAHAHSSMPGWPEVVGLGVFLLLLIHAPPFRRGVVTVLWYVWWLVRGALWDVPMSVWRSQVVREVRRSRVLRFLFRHFWSPLLVTLIVFVVLLFVVRLHPLFLLGWPGLGIWAALTLLYNTPLGWRLQDRVAEMAADWWRVVRVNLLPGLLQAFIDWFRRLANWIERQLYAVDEWLRYRGEQSNGSLAVKALLGLIWFPIAYLFRFAFYLLIEPQINPIKHFPVVTVSHKMLLPLVPNLGELLSARMGMGVTEANLWALWIIAAIPGIFGFMAWEFVANWQLYRANRAKRLRPVMLGSHGETMRGLLRPGFHSGTVPKLFRKLRHASHAKHSRLHHDLDHTAEGVHRFIERELIHLLARSPEWGGVKLEVRPIRFGCQRLVIELAAPALGADGFVLAFENVGGQVEAAIEQPGWTDKLTEGQRSAFLAALRGLLDMAAVERVGGYDRTEDAPTGPGFDSLARRVSWDEWVERWGPAKA